jgi:hypothetical protein
MELSDATEGPGIDAGTLRLVAQCLNHYATRGPTRYIVSLKVREKQTLIISFNLLLDKKMILTLNELNPKKKRYIILTVLTELKIPVTEKTRKDIF